MTLAPFSLDIGQVSLVEDGRRLTAKGRVAADPEGWRVALDVALNEIAHDNLLALWPVALVPRTRDWLVNNVQEGLLFDVKAALRLEPKTEPRLSLGYEFAGVDVRFLKTLPPIRQGHGYSTIEGNRYTLVLDRGHVTPAEGGPIDVARSVFVVPDITQRPSRAEVRLKTKSSLTAALSLLDEPPFQFLTKAGQPVTLGSGTAEIDSVLRLPLAPKVSVQEVDYTVTGRVRDFRSEVLVPGRVLTAPDLALSADATGLRVSGAGKLGEAPFDVTYAQSFGPRAKGRARIDGVVTLSQAVVDEFGLGLPQGLVSGEGRGQIAIDLVKGNPPALRLVSDLNRIGLSLPDIGWSKPRDRTGRLEVEARLGPTPAIDRLLLEGGGLQAEGRITLKPGGAGLEAAEFSRVRLNGWLDGPVTLTGRGKGRAVAVAVNGGAVDLRRPVAGQGRRGRARRWPAERASGPADRVGRHPAERLSRRFHPARRLQRQFHRARQRPDPGAGHRGAHENRQRGADQIRRRGRGSGRLGHLSQRARRGAGSATRAHRADRPLQWPGRDHRCAPAQRAGSGRASVGGQRGGHSGTIARVRSCVQRGRRRLPLDARCDRDHEGRRGRGLAGCVDGGGLRCGGAQVEHAGRGVADLSAERDRVCADAARRGAVRLQLHIGRHGGQSAGVGQPAVDPDARHVPRNFPQADPGAAPRRSRWMKLSDFDFHLPEELIATRPARPRTSARLLLAEGDGILDRRVSDLEEIFRPGDRLVLNNTRVIPARLSGVRRRMTGQGEVEARVEITLLEPAAAGGWRALAKPLRKLAPGETVVFSPDLSAEVAEKSDTDLRLVFNLLGDDFDAALGQAGAMPLPPYIAAKRAPDAQDATDYQTVFARHSGAVAAPTASLHFDTPLLEALAARGVTFTEVTLHVGAGTFLPVKVEDVTTHRMHAEWGEVTPRAADDINATRAAGGRIIPVGTTALRLIESAALPDRRMQPWQGTTDIFIYPGYRFRVTDALMTNFHLPKSTLLMLVAALMGKERMARVYDHAIARGYRFFSYGDASLLIP
jgi:S-adenosylmethionine:tRNA ribosyltransferase-isomerase